VRKAAKKATSTKVASKPVSAKKDVSAVRARASKTKASIAPAS
jgi:hypothetical protein